MPPRRQSASKSRSRSASASASPRASARPSGQAASQSPSLPSPDPVAVQRIIDEAMARVQRKRAASNAATAASTNGDGAVARPGVVRSVVNFFFGSRNRTDSPRKTTVLTDLIGAFLVTCVAVYFTVMGYWFFRELVKME